MRDAEATKKRIIETSGNLFNLQGYKATSLSDITRATGFSKGAIYRHFESKEDLEKQALGNLSDIMFTSMNEAIKNETTFSKKFEAIFSFFDKYLYDPPYKGGCPLLNAAVEGDDANPILRKKALSMLETFKNSAIRIIENGIDHGQVKPDADSESHATIFIASLEGAIMMSKLEGNAKSIKLVIQHLRALINNLKL